MFEGWLGFDRIGIDYNLVRLIYNQKKDNEQRKEFTVRNERQNIKTASRAVISGRN